MIKRLATRELKTRFGTFTEVLNELKITSIVMLANNPEAAEDRRRESIVVSGTCELDLPKTEYGKQ